MGKNNKNSKRQRYSKREEEKANRLFKRDMYKPDPTGTADFCRLCSGIARRALGIENGWTMVRRKVFQFPTLVFADWMKG